ncbi:MAG: tRNA (N6-isopentenyl adenosine(37)-C2)-methylthiotransferase MiaB [Alphaproteobacteria bacterium]|nr:tRNA (N6-isopentenyl adenosine(37)-C2)-methylthiotransferase MiaB [Alphaproteobacteria bacterium]
MTTTPKGLFIKTYGCQMNVYDSERMSDVLKPLGYFEVDSPDKAQLIVLNTCHIREKATEKVFSELGQIRRLKDEAGGDVTIAVAGCVAQAEGEEIIRRQPAVDLVVGPQSYHRLPEMLAKGSRSIEDRLETDFAVTEKFGAFSNLRNVKGPSAFLSVQEGCDKFCTFCVVPYTRGAEYSRSASDILNEAEGLVGQGVCELVLVGQNVNAWHGASPALVEGGGREQAEWDLGRLIRRLGQFEGLKRLRYTTSHPRDMNDSLIMAHREVDSLAPFLHLPVQSGSDLILKAMNRGHSVSDYLHIVDKVRRARPDMSFASDFIVGFPGETDADFEGTLSLVREVGFSQSYAFKYSPRPGTPASDMNGEVEESVKEERLSRLLSEISNQSRVFNLNTVGSKLQVLFTRKGKGEGQALGYSPHMQPVHVDGAEALIGGLCEVKIVAATGTSLTGQLVDKTNPGRADFIEART